MALAKLTCNVCFNDVEVPLSTVTEVSVIYTQLDVKRFARTICPACNGIVFYPINLLQQLALEDAGVSMEYVEMPPHEAEGSTAELINDGDINRFVLNLNMLPEAENS